MQVDPITSTLKPTGTNRLILKYAILLSSSAFKFKLRRYSVVLSSISPSGERRLVVGPARYKISLSGVASCVALW
jgi:hypothetical protein